MFVFKECTHYFVQVIVPKVTRGINDTSVSGFTEKALRHIKCKKYIVIFYLCKDKLLSSVNNIIKMRKPVHYMQGKNFSGTYIQ